MKLWNGISLDHWAQKQTLSPKDQSRDTTQWYAGYESLEMHWSDMIEEIPLEVRFSNFKSRLDIATSKHA